MQSVHEYRAHLPRPGRVEWIGLRTVRRGAVQSVEEAVLDPLIGLVGDHGKQVPPRLVALSGEGDGLNALSGPSALGAMSVPTPAPASTNATVDSRGRRQVTLLQAEHLPVIAALSGWAQVGPERLRRNLLVSGIPLLALKDRRFRLGEVILEGTGECHPCSRMEEELGPGGYNAVRGHGGITARVIRDGALRVGDAVAPLS